MDFSQENIKKKIKNSNFDSATSADSSDPKWIQDIKDGKTLIKNADGTISTMRSITFESGNKVYLAPSIRMISGKPVILNEREAVKYAIEKGDAIPFSSQKEADTFDKRFHESEYRRLGVGASRRNMWNK